MGSMVAIAMSHAGDLRTMTYSQIRSILTFD